MSVLICISELKNYTGESPAAGRATHARQAWSKLPQRGICRLAHGANGLPANPPKKIKQNPQTMLAAQNHLRQPNTHKNIQV